MSLYLLDKDGDFEELVCKVCGAPTIFCCWCCEESYCSLAHSLEDGHSDIEQEGYLEERIDVFKINEQSKIKTCSRCSNPCYELSDWPHEYEDENFQTIKETWHICWDCSFELLNGSEDDDDIGDILYHRTLADYEYDPINNPRPY